MQEQQRLVRVAARALAASGLANAYGHCSLRLDAENFLVCTAKPMGLISAEDEGVVVSVSGPLPIGVLGEVRVHQQVYRRRPEVRGICRIAPPKLFSISGLGRSPRVRHGFGAYFAPSAPFWDDTRLLRSDELAGAVADALGDARAILLRGNGAVVVGESLEQAVVLSWYLEDAARVELDVIQSIGLESHPEAAPVYSSEEAQARATFEGRVVERMWEYMIRNDPERVPVPAAKGGASS